MKILTDASFTDSLMDQLPILELDCDFCVYSSMYTHICQNCQKEFDNTKKNARFCGHKCAGIFNNRNRPSLSEDQKQKISAGLKDYFKDRKPRFTKEQSVENAAQFTRGKYHEYPPDTILKLSKRTISKIFRRMKLACSNCGWNKTACDIHHIKGRDVVNADRHDNLCYLCPNCHRLAHENQLTTFITLDKYIGTEWHKYYYG